MAIEKFLGTYIFRPLKEGEVYFCAEGCGECEKVIIEENNRTVTTREGELLERHYSKVEVSSCCKADLGIWNVVDDVESKVDAEYEFTPAEEL